MTEDRRPTDAEALEATPTDLTLADVLGAAADEAGGVVANADDDHDLRRGIAACGVRDAQRRSSRVPAGPARRGAALRTPGTATSPRGPDWVAFAPAILDDGAVDRAEAWFLSAHRRATAALRSH